MYCVKCGQKLSDKINFCPVCGNAVSANVTSVQNTDSDSPNVVTTVYDGVMIVKKISPLHQQDVYQIFDKHGKFEEEFLDIKPTEVDGLYVVKLLGDGWSFLYIDAFLQTVVLASKEAYGFIKQYDKDLFYVHNIKKGCFGLLKWSKDKLGFSTLYVTKAQIEPLEGIYYKLCRTHGDCTQYGLVEYKDGEIKTVLPIMCEDVYCDASNSEKIVVNARYGGKELRLGDDGWLSRDLRPLFNSVPDFFKVLIPIWICIVAFVDFGVNWSEMFGGIEGGIELSSSYGAFGKLQWSAVVNVVMRIAVFCLVPCFLLIVLLASAYYFCDKRGLYYAKKINVKDTIGLFDAKIREFKSGFSSTDEIKDEMHEFEDLKLKKKKFYCFDEYLDDTLCSMENA